MKKIPYLSTQVVKAIDQIVKKGKVNLVTHASNFHADDICATATLHIFFKLAYPKVKISSTRSVDPKITDAADILYDIGGVYDPRKLRFDHHQTGGAGQYDNGIKYSSFGLIWKHFGLSICALHTLAETGKLPSKKTAEHQSEILKKKLVMYIDAMDNGQMAYEAKFDGVDVFTVDAFFAMSKIRTSSDQSNLAQLNKNFTKQFFLMVKMFTQMLPMLLSYTATKEIDETKAIQAYKKAKDKRIIICDKYYYFNFKNFPEPLVMVYPDPRGQWAAKNIQEDDTLYKAKFYFPESWRGKREGELENVIGIKGARFCHNSGFLITADTKETILKMIKLAFNE